MLCLDKAALDLPPVPVFSFYTAIDPDAKQSLLLVLWSAAQLLHSDRRKCLCNLQLTGIREERCTQMVALAQCAHRSEADDPSRAAGPRLSYIWATAKAIYSDFWRSNGGALCLTEPLALTRAIPDIRFDLRAHYASRCILEGAESRGLRFDDDDLKEIYTELLEPIASQMDADSATHRESESLPGPESLNCGNVGCSGSGPTTLKRPIFLSSLGADDSNTVSPASRKDTFLIVPSGPANPVLIDLTGDDDSNGDDSGEGSGKNTNSATRNKFESPSSPGRSECESGSVSEITNLPISLQSLAADDSGAMGPASHEDTLLEASPGPATPVHVDLTGHDDSGGDDSDEVSGESV